MARKPPFFIQAVMPVLLICKEKTQKLYTFLKHIKKTVKNYTQWGDQKDKAQWKVG